MFLNCWSLKSINILNFDTSKVTHFQQMFFNCGGFKYLNLSHFTTPKVQNVNAMFQISQGLFYLDLYNYKFEPNVYVNYENIFDGLDPYCIICIHDEHTKNRICPSYRYCFCDDACYRFNFSLIEN